MLFPNPRPYSYMITGDGDDDTVLARVERAIELGVDLVQVRRKRASARWLESFVDRLQRGKPELRRRILVNERLDVALSAGALGVHLPEDGLPPAAVKSAAPPGLVVACSVHSRAQAERRARDGAAFLVFGPVFPTASKPGHPGAGVDALAEVVAAVDVPVFALGGLTADRIGEVFRTGAAGVAGISVFEREETLVELLQGLRGLSKERRFEAR